MTSWTNIELRQRENEDIEGGFFFGQLGNFPPKLGKAVKISILDKKTNINSGKNVVS